MFRRRRFVTLAVALAGLPLLLGLGGCGGADGSAASAGAAAPMNDSVAGAGAGQADSIAAPAPAVRGEPAAAPSAGVAAGAVTSGKTADNPASLAGVQLIRTADVVIQVDQLNTSAARVRAVAQSVGGTVSSEVTTFPDAGAPTVLPQGGDAAATPVKSTQPGESVIVLRVPVASLDQAVDRVAAVGKELSRTSTSQDVTADLADVGSRVKTQQASVDRVRALLAKASSLQEVVTLEGELTRRESDLEALEARQKSLADRAALSTLTVTLRTPTATVQEPPSGFAAALQRAWHAVIASTGAILTVLGALLPLVVLAAVVGLPFVTWLRRRRTPRTGAAPYGPAGPAPQGPGSQGPAGPGSQGPAPQSPTSDPSSPTGPQKTPVP